ncbi:methyltransferase, FxLD system [Actinomadura sp. LD22]|uniref:Protein-L-isoaspartate O-methyltransferase n=1 Tax=Actinomadura physcomitrii TaxID=2650748 RepID=A0A6I4MEH6_9ACTN|nr:methyltransferase, FxLD system [Actinomadura physcomitrii]MWA04618.1 methyltransferase, FxLD system [Actinomadura physcomitrii]
MRAPGWHQLDIAFPDHATAVTVAAHHLRPALQAAQHDGRLRDWWFLRKKSWRLRYRTDTSDASPIPDLLTKLTAHGRINGWTSGIYEPEEAAFGGEAAMDVAHTLFHHDSRHILTRAARRANPAVGQRETTVLLCSTLFRAAGLDFYEQGDVWKKVAELRPVGSAALAPERVAALGPAMRLLMTADPRGLRLPAGDDPFIDQCGWLTAFEQAGRDLAVLASQGRLSRGLRAILAHHVVFHGNRASVSTADQGILAHLAAGGVFDTDASDSPTPTTSTTKVRLMTTLSDDNSIVSADRLRDALTDRLRKHGVLRSARAEAAFRQTPRHLFLPGVPLDQAYADKPVYTKTDGNGVNISAASEPWMVAAMLDQLDAHPGDRILEAGAGTGYNAAIMAAIVGDAGHVTTIDVDEDLVAGARDHLAAAGIDNVEVILGDGALGHPASAPYDRIIATVGAYEVPTAWLDQLAPDGRLIVPLRLRGTNSRSITFERTDTGWRSLDSRLAVFMPLRGIGDDARRYIHLTPEQDVTLQTHKDQTVDAAAIADILHTQRHEKWTGVLFPPGVPFEWMELWLCLRLDNALMRMNVKPQAKERLSLDPMFAWGAMATVRDQDLAYLTIRPAPPAADGGKLYEVGVLGHGPTGHHLAHQVAEEIRTWDTRYRSRTVHFELQDAPAPADPASGRFVLDRPHHPITIFWE